MNHLDSAAVESAVREYFDAFARKLPDGYARALASAAGHATIDDVAAAIRADLATGPRSPSSAPALAKAARDLARTHRHEAAAPDCRCRAFPDYGDTYAGGVQAWIDDGDGLPAYAAVARCATCGRGGAKCIAVPPTADREPGDPGTRERPLRRKGASVAAAPVPFF